MDSRRWYFVLCGVISLLLGFVPLGCLLFTGGTNVEIAALGLSAVAWFCVALLLWRHNQILGKVQRAVQAVGVSDHAGSLNDVVDSFANESLRYHRAAYAFRVDKSKSSAKLGVSLSRIAILAYEELRARSVELSLFDEESGLWSQSILVGHPVAFQGQAGLAGDPEIPTEGEIRAPNNALILIKPVVFAGSIFGAIRVEFYPDEDPSDTDRQVLHLLASQAGIMLVDSRFNEEALRLRRLSDETTRAKTGFLANLSHELRGPLGIILNGVELAIDGLCGPISESLDEMLRMVKDSGDHLLDLVNDVLDYAKVEAGKVTANPIEMPLRPLLEDLVAVVRSQAISKGHELVLEEIDDVMGMFCDKRHARQILINFLTNAVKYTPDGGKITVSAKRAAQGRVLISVADTGIGIPENQRDRVFGAFERVDNQYAMAQVGTGLGMPLTKKLTEVNGGTIGFDSVAGEGSTFWIQMPSAEIHDSPAKASGEESESVMAQGHGESILLVDHDTNSREMLERYLSDRGFQVINADNGGDVLRLLREAQIELAVVENDLPDMPGEDMVAAIRSTPSAAGVPIILLSARAFVFDIERFLKLGVDRCLSKPVSLGEVALTARRLIDESRSLDNSLSH